MLILLRIVLIVYLLAVNVYSFILLRSQKDLDEENNDATPNVGKLFIAGILGGALAIYVGMFIYKYKLSNMFLMVIMPVLIVVNAYITITCFTSNFGFIL